MGRKRLNRIVARIPRISSALNFFMTAIYICCCYSQVLELCTLSRDLLAIDKL
jgi:hypothetical protein